MASYDPMKGMITSYLASPQGQEMIREYLSSPEGQKAIANYKIDGQQLFFPNANDPSA